MTAIFSKNGRNAGTVPDVEEPGGYRAAERLLSRLACWRAPAASVPARSRSLAGLRSARSPVRPAGTVLATVLFTAGAGVVFCELRRRSGSILAPAGLHWAVNGLSVLASAAVWAWATR